MIKMVDERISLGYINVSTRLRRSSDSCMHLLCDEKFVRSKSNEIEQGDENLADLTDETTLHPT